jgi:hypothetical protein
MGRKSPKPPPEDATVIAQRQQSVLDLASLNDETNRRIKQLRSASKGVRAFRALNSSASSASLLGSSSGGIGSTTSGASSGGSGAQGGYNLNFGAYGGG